MMISNEATRLEQWHKILELCVTNSCWPKLDPPAYHRCFKKKSDGWIMQTPAIFCTMLAIKPCILGKDVSCDFILTPITNNLIRN